MVKIVMIVFGVCILPVVVHFVTLWTDSNLEFWLSLIKKEMVNVPYWISLLITILLNGIIVIANIISELIRLVI